MIVSLAVFSTLFCYMLQIIGVLGQFFITIDTAITPLIIFLSFNFNRYYFKLLSCDKLTKYCCKPIERYCFKTMSNDEIKIAEIVSNKNKVTEISVS